MFSRTSFGILILSFLLSNTQVYSQSNPVDKKATSNTIRLYKWLKKISASGKYLFGHQDDLAYGVNWKYEDGRSDIKDVTGDYPALYGWELGGLENKQENNLDGVPFKKMRSFIQSGYEHGAVITISWHGTNPLTGKSAWDPSEGTVASILPGGEKHDNFKHQLDEIAIFLESLKDKEGDYIPVLFRPYHELTGNWFWWGPRYTTKEQFKKLFRFTIDYLKDVKGLHHLLYVYNTSGDFNSKKEFLSRYPGDNYADIVSFDEYQHDTTIKSKNKFVFEINKKLKIISTIANDKNKPYALAETGYEAIPDANWWTHTLVKAIGNTQPCYILVWRNHGYQEHTKRMHYYAPYKGQISEADFLNFYRLPQTLFGSDVEKCKLYR